MSHDLPHTLTCELSPELLAIALGTPGMGNRRVGLPFLFWGRPGAGKTSFIENLLSQLGWGMMVLTPQHDEVTYGMVPVIDQQTKRVTTYAPSWVDRLTGDSCVVLDDLTSSSAAVQAAQLRMLTHREIASTELPPGARLIGIANPPRMGTNARPLDPATANRLLHISLRSSEREASYLIGSHFTPKTLKHNMKENFAKLESRWWGVWAEECEVWAGFTVSSKVFETVDVRDDLEVEIEASPRTVELAARAVAAARCLDATLLIPALVAGAVGRGVANAYQSYVMRRDIPTVSMAMDGWRPNQETKSDSIFVLLSKLSRQILAGRAAQAMHGDYERLIRAYMDIIETAADVGLPTDIVIPSAKELFRAGVMPPPRGKVSKILESILL